MLSPLPQPGFSSAHTEAEDHSATLKGTLQILLSLKLSRAFSLPPLGFLSPSTWISFSLSVIFNTSHSLVSQDTSKVHHTLLFLLLLLHAFYFTACLVFQYQFKS